MKSGSSERSEESPLGLTRRIDQLCDRFALALKGGRSPPLASYIQQIDACAASELLVELVALQLDHLKRQGVEDPLAEMQAQNRALGPQIEAAVAHLAEAESRRPFAEVSFAVSPCPTDAGRGLHVRCPNCREPIELIVDSSLTNVLCSSCGRTFSLIAEDAEEKHAPPSAMIGHFRLLDRIGVGSFGTVWRAYDTHLDRIVAIKVPRKGQLQASELEQFFREARAAAQLNHPCIVSVHEVGKDGVVSYIVSDYVSGLTLSEWMTKEPTNHREATELCIHIALALEHAHQRGVVHRDLKPQNILIDERGLPHITDFGLAKRDAGEITMTADGQLMGTPAYMSPEQARFEAHNADARSDVYSLGVILFQLLTGELPFRGSVPAIIEQVLHEDPPDPRVLNQRIDIDLATICQKCLEKAPGLRYPSAGALAEELRLYLVGEPITARRPSCWQRGRRRGTRFLKQLDWRAAALCAAAAFVVAIGSFAWVRRADYLARYADQLAAARAEELTAIKQTNQIIAAYAALDEGWPKKAQELLNDSGSRWHSANGTGLEWGLLDSLTRPPSSTTLLGHDGPVNELAVLPSGGRLASVGADGLLKIWDVLSGDCLRSIDAAEELPGIDLASGGLHSLAISPDGTQLVFGADIVGRISLDADAPVRELYRADYNVESLAFSHDGKKIVAGIRYDGYALISSEGDVLRRRPGFTRANTVEFIPQRQNWLLTHAETTKGVSLLQLLDRDFNKVQFAIDPRKLPRIDYLNIARSTPDGDFAAAGAAASYGLHLFDLATGEVVATFPHYREYLSDLCFSPDGQTVAIGFHNGVIRCHRLNRSDEKAIEISPQMVTFAAHEGSVRCTRFVDEETLASCGDDGAVKLFRPFETSARQALDPDPSPLARISFAPGEQRFAATHAQLRRVSIYESRTAREVVGRDYPAPVQAQWSPTGRQIAVCSFNDPLIRVVDEQLQDLNLVDNQRPVHWIAFSPDGKILASIDEQEITLRSSTTFEVVQSLQSGETGTNLAFSHDGGKVAFGTRAQTVGIWNLRPSAAREVIELPSDAIANCLVFSPDDELLASGHTDGIIRLWHVDDATLLAEFVGHRSGVNRIFFTPDGRGLLSMAVDATSRIWSVPLGQCYGVIDQLILDVSTSGRMLIVSYLEGPVPYARTYLQKIR